MSSENNDNLYVLEEDKEFDDIDNSPMNFAAYSDEERENEENQSPVKKISVFGLLLNIMFNPVEGWKKLRRSKISIEKIQSGCFYPLLAILAICKFSDYFYSVNVTLQNVITQAVISFVSFFFGYFCIQMFLSWFLSKETSDHIEEKFAKEYILVSLSTLVIFTIFIELLPMIWPILIFLPLWTLYIMFKGVRFFHLPSNKEMKFYIITSIVMIGVPMVIEMGLNSILPY